MCEQHFDFIWRLIRRLGLKADEADDAAQEVFVVAMRRIEAVQAGSERSFLFGTAVRIAADRRRARARGRELNDQDLDLCAGTVALPDEQAEQQRARELLDVVLDGMEDEVRTVFVLYELEGMTTREIGETLAIPAGTAASRLRRGREEFAKLIQKVQRQYGLRMGAP
jgi:RNA polymerase sigma-70 factor, ECF subfamily